jgi:hypothetical protein
MYKGTQYLSNENVTRDVKVQMILYNIEEIMNIPFLRFYLLKDCDTNNNICESSIEKYIEENEYLTFPSIDYKSNDHFLFTLYCQSVVESLFYEERQYIKKIQHKGHYLDEDENTAYAFFEITPTTTEAEYMSKGSFIWSVLMNEIMNGSCCSVPIHSLVTSFFVSNPNYIHLTQLNEVDNNEVLIYDMPIVVYYPVNTDLKKTKFIAMFGTPRNDGNFVFYSYSNAMDILKKSKNKYTGLVRIALYSGNTTIDINEFESDPEIKTLYKGNEYCVKDYSQQKPLSYHHVVNKGEYNIII